MNKAWYKRVVPQNTVTACVFENYIYTADDDGKIYREDFGLTFAGQPIKFMWKSPFLTVTSPHHRKMIDEFYFLLDTEFDNNFKFSIFKDYDSEHSDDGEHIYYVHKDCLIWGGEGNSDTEPDDELCIWGDDSETGLIWSISSDALEKAEISDSNYSVQICIEGDEITHSCAIIGLQFREIYNDD